MGAQGRYESIATDFKEETLPSGDAKSNLSSEHEIDQSPNHDNRLMSAEESLGKEDLETRLPFASPIRFHGWRGGIAFALLITALAFLTNFVLLIWLAARHTFQNGLTTTYSGSCSHVQSLNVWAHLGINAVSTLMLGASSYCMQCLSSPTREEVDNAHAERRWLDIGVPGIRNLGSIAPYKRWLWALLAVSSIPLHLLYNSTFYAALSSNDYRIFVVTPEFVRGTVNLAPDALQGSYNFTPNHEVDFR